MRIITLKLDKEYEMRFSTMALLRLEKSLGKPIVDFFQDLKKGQEDFNLETIFNIVLCGVKEFRDKTAEDVAELVDDYAPGETTMEKFAYVFKTTVEAMNESMVGDEKKRAEAAKMMAELEKSATALTGGSSKATQSPSESPPSNSGT